MSQGKALVTGALLRLSGGGEARKDTHHLADTRRIHSQRASRLYTCCKRSNVATLTGYNNSPFSLSLSLYRAYTHSTHSLAPRGPRSITPHSRRGTESRWSRSHLISARITESTSSMMQHFRWSLITRFSH